MKKMSKSEFVFEEWLINHYNPLEKQVQTIERNLLSFREAQVYLNRLLLTVGIIAYCGFLLRRRRLNDEDNSAISIRINNTPFTIICTGIVGYTFYTKYFGKNYKIKN